MGILDRLFGGRGNQDLPERYISGRHYNCFMETVEPHLQQAAYEELKKLRAIHIYGVDDRGTLLMGVRSLKACMDAYNRVATQKKSAYKLDKKDLVRVMLEDPNADFTFITESGYRDGKKIHHAEKHKLTNIVMSSEPYFVKASEFHQKGNHGEALRYYDKAIEAEPLDARAWNNKGFLLYKAGKYGEAVECYNKALDIAPKMMGGQVWVNKGNALEEMGRHDEAIECYDKVLK